MFRRIILITYLTKETTKVVVYLIRQKNRNTLFVIIHVLLFLLLWMQLWTTEIAAIKSRT